MSVPALPYTRIGLVVLALVALVAGIAAPPAPAAETAPDNRYSSKQPYVAPIRADIAKYEPAPAGYRPLATETVARHGSRGLSSYKYDALLRRMAETAQSEGGFRSPEIATALLQNIDALTAANVQNGYGMLTGQGATQHQGIGARAYRRNATLFAAAAARGDHIVAETSGEPRASESGENS